MDSFTTSLANFLNLDLKELWAIIWLSLKVSGSSLIIATILGLPVAALLGLKRFPLRGALINVLNTFMGLPPVVVGLAVYLLLSRQGPLGVLAMLYTPSAMVVAQTILAFPIVASLSYGAIVSVNPVIRQAALALGATPWQQALTIIREARFGILSGIIAGLGRATAEVGAVIIVGGNIAGYTRVMTTTIALETDKGNFELAIVLGVVLLAIALVLNIGLRLLQRMGGGTVETIAWD